MKVAPLYHGLKKEKCFNAVLVHTGQHYDFEMSDVFIGDLGLPKPDIYLGIGSGTHAEQTGRVMMEYEKTCFAHKPDLVIVSGDVNSTMAATITAKKMHIPVAHLEAGLRSRDTSMPEEINRMVTDILCDLLWTPSPDADENLIREGILKERIVRVGNIMLDSYEMLRSRIKSENTAKRLGKKKKNYGIVTLHRPTNVDEKDSLAAIVSSLISISKKIPLVFSVHPRTKAKLKEYSFYDSLMKYETILMTEPLGYIEFMNLVEDSAMVITDSGGIQEETTYLNIPCLTMRENTERPITITQGTNRLVNPSNIEKKVEEILGGHWSYGKRPEYWDGHTTKRVIESLNRFFHISSE